MKIISDHRYYLEISDKSLHMISPDLRGQAADAISVLTNQSPFADVHVEVHEPVGELDQEKQQILENIIRENIREDRSHLVTGVYMIDNISSRPKNTYVIIGQSNIILNISEHQILMIENQATAGELQFVADLITQLAEVFIFASGSGIIDKLTELEYDNRSDNIVFELDELKLEKMDKYARKFDYVNLLNENSDYSEDKLAAFALAIWDYGLTKFRSISTPHIVALNDKGQPMGGARVNGETGDMAAIGGVITLPAFRNQGVGTGVSQILSGLLVEQNTRVVLETDDENIPALKIYRKLGFDEVGNSVFLDFGTNQIEQIRGNRDY